MVSTSIDGGCCLGKAALARTRFPLGAGIAFAGADTARFSMCGVAAAATAHVGRVGVRVPRAVQLVAQALDGGFQPRAGLLCVVLPVQPVADATVRFAGPMPSGVVALLFLGHGSAVPVVGVPPGVCCAAGPPVR